jgi:hypothetical protein
MPKEVTDYTPSPEPRPEKDVKFNYDESSVRAKMTTFIEATNGTVSGQTHSGEPASAPVGLITISLGGGDEIVRHAFDFVDFQQLAMEVLICCANEECPFALVALKAIRDWDPAKEAAPTVDEVVGEGIEGFLEEGDEDEEEDEDE